MSMVSHRQSGTLSSDIDNLFKLRLIISPFSIVKSSDEHLRCPDLDFSMVSNRWSDHVFPFCFWNLCMSDFFFWPPNSTFALRKLGFIPALIWPERNTTLDPTSRWENGCNVPWCNSFCFAWVKFELLIPWSPPVFDDAEPGLARISYLSSESISFLSILTTGYKKLYLVISFGLRSF